MLLHHPLLQFFTTALLTFSAASLPPPDHYASIGWFVVITVGGVIALDKVMDFWCKHVRHEPDPSRYYALREDVRATRCELIEQIDRLARLAHDAHARLDQLARHISSRDWRPSENQPPEIE